jgi:aspartate racemase
MKKIGIIGGLGPEATVDYYSEIINAFKQKNSNFNYPEILIYSVNMSELFSHLEHERYEKAADYLCQRIDALKKAGADFAVISANTPHLLFDRIREKSTLPLISIVESTFEQAKRMKLQKPGLFGTKITMNATFYADFFRQGGMQVIVPDDEGKRIINEKLFAEIELGIFKDETRELLLSIVKKMKEQNGIDSLILGCTELPLLFKNPTYLGIPCLNTTRIHVESIVKFCLAE